MFRPELRGREVLHGAKASSDAKHLPSPLSAVCMTLMVVALGTSVLNDGSFTTEPACPSTFRDCAYFVLPSVFLETPHSFRRCRAPLRCASKSRGLAGPLATGDRASRQSVNSIRSNVA